MSRPLEIRPKGAVPSIGTTLLSFSDYLAKRLRTDRTMTPKWIGGVSVDQSGPMVAVAYAFVHDGRVSILTFFERVLGSGKEKQASDLSREIQNYIDNRIRDTDERLTTRIEKQVRDIANEKWKWIDNWRDVLKYGGWIAFAVMLVVGKSQVRGHVEKATREYLTTNVAHQVAMEGFRAEVRSFTESHLNPLKDEEFGSWRGKSRLRRWIRLFHSLGKGDVILIVVSQQDYFLF